MRVAAVAAPKDGNDLNALLQSIAAATGGLVFNDDLGIDFCHFTLEMMGVAKKVIVGRKKTVVIGAARALEYSYAPRMSRNDLSAKRDRPDVPGPAARLPPFNAETAKRLLVHRFLGPGRI
jgi:hypothetical protein